MTKQEKEDYITLIKSQPQSVWDKKGLTEMMKIVKVVREVSKNDRANI